MKTFLSRIQAAGLMTTVFLLFTACTGFAQTARRPDILISDFESETYGEWKAEGEAFGSGPAEGPLAGQMQVSGFHGRRLVNSFFQGDRTTGTLTSPEFTIQRPWINFLIGGGGHEGKTCLNLLVNGKVVRSEVGANTSSGGSEELHSASWDVADLVGKTAVLRIVDQHTGGWGHINVDHIVLSDTNTAPILIALSKTFKVSNTHLIMPVSNSGKQTLLGIYEADTLVQSFTVALPQGDEPSWLAAYPIEHFGLRGKEITLAPVDAAGEMPEAASPAFDRIKVGSSADAEKADDYQQPYRDQFHITTRRGWNNDPNGMVFHNGKYHLYYQYNPFGIGWGNMHWGHFESTDLLHWNEKPIALYQKTVNDMAFSGGGFVDFNNSAGLGENTMFVAFTSTGRGECLAYSKDGGLSFTELEENPVVKHTGRDPKIIWIKPEQKWVMAVYDETACAETAAVQQATETLPTAILRSTNPGIFASGRAPVHSRIRTARPCSNARSCSNCRSRANPARLAGSFSALRIAISSVASTERHSSKSRARMVTREGPCMRPKPLVMRPTADASRSAGSARRLLSHASRIKSSANHSHFLRY